jgi:hypothetical protein
LLQKFLPVQVDSNEQEKPSSLDGSAFRINQWRTILTRLASLHAQSFPNSVIRNSPYDPCPDPRADSKTNFPYLYLDTSYHYDSTANMLKDFTLYDLTQRALDCLILLCTKPEGNLSSGYIRRKQQRIVGCIRTVKPTSDGFLPLATQNNASDVTTATTIPEDDLNKEAVKQVPASSPGATEGPSQDDLQSTIKFLSFLLAYFLDLWDGYLSENFHVEGRLKNNDLELNAYQAGRSLASLSWDIALKTVPLENKFSDKGAISVDSPLIKSLTETWEDAFKLRSINTITRQISCLGPALDDAYYLVNSIQRPVISEQLQNDLPPQSITLPSRSIQAITYSLMYWQRAIQKICDDTKKYLESLQEQTTGQSAVEPGKLILTKSNVRHLRIALINQSEIWLSLMLYEQTLASFTGESATKSILNTFMQDFESALKNQLLDIESNQVKRYRTPLLISALILVLVVLVGGFIFLVLQASHDPTLTAVITLIMGSVLSILSAGVSRLGSIFSPASHEQSPDRNSTSNSINSMIGFLNTIVNSTEGANSKAFQNGLQQIHNMYANFNHYVAITYPLTLFYQTKLEHLDTKIKSGESYFLEHVVWTSAEQKEELKQIASAAFGPLGAIIHTQISEDTEAEDQEQQVPGWLRWLKGERKSEGIIVDTFERKTDQIYWGKASDGNAWRGDARNSKVFSIGTLDTTSKHVGHIGRVEGQVETINGWTNYSAVIGPVTTNAQVKFTGSIDNFKETNFGAVLRWKDGDNFYKAYIDGSSMVLLKKVKGTITTIKTVPFVAKKQEDYTLRFRVDGTTLTVNVWQGQNEPSEWMIRATDKSLRSGYCGLRMLVQNDAVVTIKEFSAQYNNV